MAMMRRYMSLKQICDILVVVPKGQKKNPKQNITMSCHNVQYSNENCHYMMAGSFADFTCLLKSYQVETTGSSGNHCYLKHTHLKKKQKNKNPQY